MCYKIVYPISLDRYALRVWDVCVTLGNILFTHFLIGCPLKIRKNATISSGKEK